MLFCDGAWPLGVKDDEGKLLPGSLQEMPRRSRAQRRLPVGLECQALSSVWWQPTQVSDIAPWLRQQRGGVRCTSSEVLLCTRVHRLAALTQRATASWLTRWEPQPLCVCAGHNVGIVSELTEEPGISAGMDVLAPVQPCGSAWCVQLSASAPFTAQD